MNNFILYKKMINILIDTYNMNQDPIVKIMPDNIGIQISKEFIKKGAKESKQSNIHCIACVIIDLSYDSKYWFIDMESKNNKYYNCYHHDNTTLDKCYKSGSITKLHMDKIRKKKEEADIQNKENVVFFSKKLIGSIFNE